MAHTLLSAGSVSRPARVAGGSRFLDRERAPHDRLSVAALRALAVSRPDDPAVAARHEAPRLPAEPPAPLELVARPRRPDAQELALAAEELHVVIAGTLYRGPPQQWRGVGPEDAPRRGRDQSSACAVGCLPPARRRRRGWPARSRRRRRSGGEPDDGLRAGVGGGVLDADLVGVARPVVHAPVHEARAGAAEHDARGLSVDAGRAETSTEVASGLVCQLSATLPSPLSALRLRARRRGVVVEREVARPAVAGPVAAPPDQHRVRAVGTRVVDRRGRRRGRMWRPWRRTRTARGSRTSRRDPAVARAARRSRPVPSRRT